MEMLMKAEMMTMSSHLLMFMSPYLFFFFLVFKNFGRKLLYNVVLFSAVQQCKSAIIIHMLSPS